MFSILLKVKTCNSSDKWKYLCNDDGSIYQNEDLEQVRLKVIQLLKDHTLTDIKVVSNKRAIQHIVIEGNPDEPGVWLPEVTVDDNGKVLMVINGEWDKGTVEVGDVLPEVTTEDNGKILKVIEGAWAVGDDEHGDTITTEMGIGKQDNTIFHYVVGTIVSTNEAREHGANALPPNLECVELDIDDYNAFVNDKFVNIITKDYYPSSEDYQYFVWNTTAGSTRRNQLIQTVYMDGQHSNQIVYKQTTFNAVQGYLGDNGKIYSGSIINTPLDNLKSISINTIREICV